MTATADRGPESVDELLRMRPAELDALFRSRPAGPIPDGEGRGRFILLGGTALAEPLSRIVHALFWQGKVFDAAAGRLDNLVGPLGMRAVPARVEEGSSWLDEGPCVALDYSQTSWVAGWIHDELREVTPGLLLGIAWGSGRLFGGRRLLLRFALAFG